jgi:hypothetical protein
LRIGDRGSAWFSRDVTAAAFLHTALNARSTHAAKLQSRFIYVVADAARQADSLFTHTPIRLAPLQPHSTHAAKFMLWTVLSTTKGTKHEVLDSFELCFDTRHPKNSSSAV